MPSFLWPLQAPLECALKGKPLTKTWMRNFSVHRLIRSEFSSTCSKAAFQDGLLACCYWSLSEQILRCCTVIEAPCKEYSVNIAGCFGLYFNFGCSRTKHKEFFSQNIPWIEQQLMHPLCLHINLVFSVTLQKSSHFFNARKQSTFLLRD